MSTYHPVDTYSIIADSLCEDQRQLIMAIPEELYEERTLSEGYPDLHKLAHESFSSDVSSRPDDTPRVEKLRMFLGRLVKLDEARRILVLGCGPHPQPMQIWLSHGHIVTGVEPVESFVEAARDYLQDETSVRQGAAESIPLPDNSQDVVIFESVLEHVDSIPDALNEIYRVLAPGGVLFLTTTVRTRFSVTGFNGEYNVRFYNWFPRVVKEGYILKHLHYEPRLANYTERPAVHWFSFADLCSRGRDAGFAQFYSHMDLMRLTDPHVIRSWLRRTLLRHVQQNPWVRAFALSQVGSTIFMLKR
jgi:2-polyprenyl-6-hydroxyphenyl methylase/3-demethylubiquinone-9 3-methyltransferase